MPNSRLKGLFVGLPKTVMINGKEFTSGIYKKRVDQAYLTLGGFEKDDVADPVFHGGPDRAVCLYPYEHYAFWENELQRRLSPCSFGENITVEGMREQDVFIGDIYRIGEAVIQVSQGRVPCYKINNRTNEESLLSRIIETGYTGYFFRVLQEGTIMNDSEINLMERHQGEVSVLFANQIFFHNYKDREGIEKILELKELASAWREKLEKK